jgi:hypothetical protein
MSDRIRAIVLLAACISFVLAAAGKHHDFNVVFMRP